MLVAVGTPPAERPPVGITPLGTSATVPSPLCHPLSSSRSITSANISSLTNPVATEENAPKLERFACLNRCNMRVSTVDTVWLGASEVESGLRTLVTPWACMRWSSIKAARAASPTEAGSGARLTLACD